MGQKDSSTNFSNMIPQGQAGKRFVSLFTKGKLECIYSQIKFKKI